MAQIIKRQSEQKKPKKSPLIPIAFFCFAVAILNFVLSSFVIGFLCVVIGAVLLGVAPGSSGQSAAENAGMVGETATANLIRQLPEGYYGFQNVHITFDGKPSEMDMVVVGRTGVFIIETKHHNGNICGSYEDHDWMQYKIGRRGGQYNKQFYSPVKQVGTHVYRLAHFLRGKGVNVHVDAMVFFTNPEAYLRITGTPGNIPVYAGQPGAEALCRQIMAGQSQLSPQQIHAICNLLNQCL